MICTVQVSYHTKSRVCLLGGSARTWPGDVDHHVMHTPGPSNISTTNEKCHFTASATIKIEPKPGSSSFVEKSSEEVRDIINAQLKKKAKLQILIYGWQKYFKVETCQFTQQNNAEIKKLQANLNQAQVLKEVRVVVKFFCIAPYDIFLYKINMKNKNIIIQHLIQKNKNVFFNLTISLNNLFKVSIRTKTINLFIIEVINLVIVNQIIDKKIIIKFLIYTYILYHPKY